MLEKDKCKNCKRLLPNLRFRTKNGCVSCDAEWHEFISQKPVSLVSYLLDENQKNKERIKELEIKIDNMEIQPEDYHSG